MVTLWHPKVFTMELRNYRKMTIRWSFSYNLFVKLSLIHSQHSSFQWTPNIAILSTEKYRVFRNTGLDPLNNHKATKPAFNVWPLSACQQNAMFVSPLKKPCQSWTPSGKTFWIRAWNVCTLGTPEADDNV